MALSSHVSQARGYLISLYGGRVMLFFGSYEM